MEEKGDFAFLHAIFYCEFHHIQGPQVVFEVPDGLIKSTAQQQPSVTLAMPQTPALPIYRPDISPEPFSLNQQRRNLQNDSSTDTDHLIDFDSISEYIIPKPILCNRLVTISTTHHKIMGYPVSIEDPKYKRNALLFNLCFVFNKGADTSSYEQVVRKVARVLRSLEEESEFLNNAETKRNVLNIMEQLLQDLNTYSECKIPINDAEAINLKLFPTYGDPAPVHDWQVPVALLALDKIMDKYWDMTLRRIIPYINGVLSVRKISQLADVEGDLVRISIQHLLYYGAVKMVDIFQFSNVYSTNQTLHSILYSPELQTECIDFIRRKDRVTPPPSFNTLFILYSKLRHGLTVKEWIEDNNIWNRNVDIRRMIVFGVIKGFLSRVHRYPILSGYSTQGTTTLSPPNEDLKKYAK
ncbi:Nitrogen permease regulator 2 [Chytridiales sp. JEL 0842]|nr:Nitrogen permease regulator 2 [Chytridiales sp. JEL 0842]